MVPYPRKSLLGFCLVIVFAYTDSRAEVGFPAPRPLGEEFETFMQDWDPETNENSAATEPIRELNLETALRLVLQHNPQLRQSASDVFVGDALAEQKGRRPNPELEFEVENLAGTGELSGVDATELALVLNQAFELGDKPAKRKRVATLERNLAGWDFEAQRLRLITELRKQFVTVLAAQQKVTIAEQHTETASEVLRTVSELVRAGKGTPLDRVKSENELARARVELDKTRAQLQSARIHLAAVWGDSEPRFDTVQGDLEITSPVPSIEMLLSRLEQNPDVARWDDELSHQDAILDLERARSIPDLAVGVGVKYERESGDTALVGGMSIPLPFFNRNQGAIRAARIAGQQFRGKRDAKLADAKSRLIDTHQVLVSESRAVKTLRENILPGADEVFGMTRRAYTAGKIGYLDVLDAQRTRFVAQQQYFQALVRFHRAWIDAEGVIGSRLIQND